MEEADEKKKRTCTGCRVFGNHDKRTCPLLKMKVPEISKYNFDTMHNPPHFS
ncbi:hypothetical protein GIB67_007770 [Kingdonia uniflora]|uniref:Uncharacterized protein n=1 Tax=Kingdonia uniflora TaxID=39325 RepID=A0A7J7N1Q8_9MAGN|nr:hypothetical protein GIB67_007770 [Kingdonia uniflora]